MRHAQERRRHARAKGLHTLGRGAGPVAPEVHQRGLERLARGIGGQTLREHHVLGVFIRGKMRGAMQADLLRRGLVTRLEHQHSLQALGKHMVGHTHHRRAQHCRVWPARSW